VSRILRLFGGGHIVEPPVGWTRTLPLTIKRLDGTFQALSPAGKAFDVADLAPVGAGTTFYVDIARPNNTGNGQSWATAEKGVKYGIQDANAAGDIVLIAPGVYDYDNGWQGYGVQHNMQIKASAPGVILSNHLVLSYALDGTLTHTYVAAHGHTAVSMYQTRDALYPDANGDYQKLTLQASAAAVEAAPGSWFADATNLYVRLSDDRAPDANLRPYYSYSNSKCAYPYTIYLEGIEFHGGTTPFNAAASGVGAYPTIYAKNCTFKYSQTNGLSTTGADTILQGCLAACNTDDGFNYHLGYTRPPQAIEISCIGRDNGAAGDIDNGSSSHEGANVLRIMGEYMRNVGINVHDVGLGTQSWNLGTIVHDSAGGVNDVNFGIGNDSTLCTMWLDHCRSYGSAADLNANTNALLHARACITEGHNSGAGTIDAY